MLLAQIRDHYQLSFTRNHESKYVPEYHIGTQVLTHKLLPESGVNSYSMKPDDMNIYAENFNLDFRV